MWYNLDYSISNEVVTLVNKICKKEKFYGYKNNRRMY
jgi:hypothetical protein